MAISELNGNSNIGDGRVFINNNLRSVKLERVDNNVFETAQTGFDF